MCGHFKIAIVIFINILAVSAFAVPARRGLWKTIRLTDGSEIRAELRGDEYGHWWQAEDGRRFVDTDSSGVFQVMDSTVSANNAKRRMAAQQRRAAAKRQLISASTDDGIGKYGTSGAGAVNTIGEYTFPVIMVQFSDTKFQSATTVDKMTRYYNEDGYSEEDGCVGSVRDYFKSQSYGMFVPNFDVVGIVTLSRSYTYYGKNNSYGSDSNVDGLVSDAVAAAVSQLGVDFSKYISGNGVPLVCILYAGGGEATGGGDDTVWPCEYDCETTMSGTYFRSYFVGNELYGNNLMGIGVFCHEFGHAAGLPDWYCTDYSYSNDDAFGDWSIMDTGAYVGNSYAPVGYTALERSMLGWLDIPEASAAAIEDSVVTLADPNEPGISTVRIPTTSSKENFILENRQAGTWYNENSNGTSYGSGLMLTRIAYNADDWNNDVVNNTQDMKRCMMVTADRKKMYYYLNVSQSNLYGNGVDSITSLSLYGGSRKAVNIGHINKNDDGTVSFVLGQPSSTNILFQETFDQCSGRGGNDGKFSNISSSAIYFNPDNDGWEGYYCNGGDSCAWFGSSRNVGWVVTPAFTLPGDTATLSFRAAAWNTKNEGTSLQISVYSGNVEMPDGEGVTLTKGEFNSYALRLVGSGDVRLEFLGNKRFFLDDVVVTANNVNTGITTAKVVRRVKDSRIYTISGEYAGTDLNALPKGVYIAGGRKIIR